MKINLHLFRSQKDDVIVAKARREGDFSLERRRQDLAKPFGPLTLPDAKSTALVVAPRRRWFSTAIASAGGTGRCVLTRRGNAHPLRQVSIRRRHRPQPSGGVGPVTWGSHSNSSTTPA